MQTYASTYKSIVCGVAETVTSTRFPAFAEYLNNTYNPIESLKPLLRAGPKTVSLQGAVAAFPLRQCLTYNRRELTFVLQFWLPLLHFADILDISESFCMRNILCLKFNHFNTSYQGRNQGGATGANAPARLSGAPEDLLLAYVESQQYIILGYIRGFLQPNALL